MGESSKAINKVFLFCRIISNNPNGRVPRVCPWNSKPPLGLPLGKGEIVRVLFGLPLGKGEIVRVLFGLPLGKGEIVRVLSSCA
ncbi:MAG: hypothetical protein COT16_01050 [Elusimicrobia bacterium CG08_land_8_20_14_0_20_44_26]|nr:MAG: hypothetical protein COT16_01050 [Elusimicrobia bacterium CG08_land_8_20_14_0_20_44_26]